MRIILQRVSQASVTIAGEQKAGIGPGFLIFLGVEHEDNEDDVEWLVKKIAGLRVFSDAAGLMNCSIREVADGKILVISQFTLYASTRKGNRPSFIRAARPEAAIPLYEKFVETLARAAGCPVLTGVFGADMQVGLLNDGPVTIIIDSKNRE